MLLVETYPLDGEGLCAEGILDVAVSPVFQHPRELENSACARDCKQRMQLSSHD